MKLPGKKTVFHVWFSKKLIAMNDVSKIKFRDFSLTLWAIPGHKGGVRYMRKKAFFEMIFSKSVKVTALV